MNLAATHIRVSGFRCLRSVELQLDRETVLLGGNNSGKTSLLEALNLALGAGRRVFSPEDVFVADQEAAAPLDRRALIDIMLQPVNEQGDVVATFPEGSAWLELWGSAIALDSAGNEFLCLRTIGFWDAIRGHYSTRRVFLRRWPTPEEFEIGDDTLENEEARRHQLDPVAVYFLGAARDITEEMHSRASYWQRLIGTTQLSSELAASIEQRLSDINDEITSGSPVLGHIKGHLDNVGRTITAHDSSAEISPLSRRVSDLRHGVDISLIARGGRPLSISRQGAAARSMASIAVLQAFVAWEHTQKEAGAIHSIAVVEEPETHLQPQAQKSLMHCLRTVPGQLIVSTHSPSVIAQVDVSRLRHFHMSATGSVVTRLDVNGMDDRDIASINRQVIASRGELCFARAIVLMEGETEEIAVPIMADAFFGVPHQLTGVTYVAVRGYGAYRPFLRLAKSFGIPWFLMSDGEGDAVGGVNAMLKREGEEPIERNARAFALPGGINFERACAVAATNELVEMVVAEVSRSPQHREKVEAEWNQDRDRVGKLVAQFESAKLTWAPRIAKCLGGLGVGHFPQAMRQMFQAMRDSGLFN